MKRSQTIKYIQRYGEPESAYLVDNGWKISNHKTFDYACLIPAANEKIETLDQLLVSIQKSADYSNVNILTLIAINSNCDSPKQWIENNNLLFDLLKKKTRNHTHPPTTFPLARSFLGDYLGQTLWVLKSTFKKKRGVGQARKKISDLACVLYAKTMLKSNLLFSLDCDCKVPLSYFDFLPCETNCDTPLLFIHNFIHTSHKDDPKPQKEACKQYDRDLKLYAQKLAEAGSPYGFCAIGSCLIYNVTAYVLARGFPKKRLAGEDFYLINKIAKFTSIKHKGHTPIEIEGRLSSRVPFGTGQAIRSLCKQKKDNYYLGKKQLENNFILLKLWLNYARDILSSTQTNIANKDHFLLFYQKTDENEELKKTVLEVSAYLEKKNHFHILSDIQKRTKIKTARIKRFNSWFDALKTRQFLTSNME